MTSPLSRSHSLDWVTGSQAGQNSQPRSPQTPQTDSNGDNSPPIEAEFSQNDTSENGSQEQQLVMEK